MSTFKLYWENTYSKSAMKAIGFRSRLLIPLKI